MLSKPNDYNFFVRFDGPSFDWILMTVTPTTAKKYLHEGSSCSQSAFIQRATVLHTGNYSEDLKFVRVTSQSTELLR